MLNINRPESNRVTKKITVSIMTISLHDSDLQLTELVVLEIRDVRDAIFLAGEVFHQRLPLVLV